jgi:hypothetical protein
MRNHPPAVINASKIALLQSVEKISLSSEGRLVGRPPFVWAFVPTWIAFDTQKIYLGLPPSIFTLRTVAPNNIAPKDTIVFPSARDVREREMDIASGILGITNVVRKKKKVV